MDIHRAQVVRLEHTLKTLVFQSKNNPADRVIRPMIKQYAAAYKEHTGKYYGRIRR